MAMPQAVYPACQLLRRTGMSEAYPRFNKIGCLDRLLRVLKSKHSGANDLWAWKRPASILRMNRHITLPAHSRECVT